MPEYYMTKYIPEIIKNPRKRTIWENTLISCINDDKIIIPLINDAIEKELTKKLNSQISSLLSSYKFSEADKIFAGNKERFIDYDKQRNEAMQKFIVDNVQQIKVQLDKYNFLKADQLYQKIQDYFPREDYCHLVVCQTFRFDMV